MNNLEVIKIEKERAKERMKMGLLTSLIITSVILYLFIAFCINLFVNLNNNFLNLYLWILPLIFLIFGWIQAGRYYLFTFRINSLEYSIDEENNILIKSWTNILKIKNKDTARLQIVNSVNINQGWFDKICGIFTVLVDYGFASSGYTFTFDYLSEEEAERVSKLIKVKNTSKVELR